MLTDKQLRAVKNLEIALAQCAKEGVALVGLRNLLLACSRREIKAHGLHKTDNQEDDVRALCLTQYVQVQDNYVYLDSIRVIP